jgi:SAM-dependent methyltransferase
MKNTANAHWEHRWMAAQTGWDLGIISPPLRAYFDTPFDKNQRILIPGCGNAYEAIYLLEKGFSHITVIDIAPSLTQNLNKKLADFVASGKLTIVCGDFFEHKGKYDLIVEQTFFCAIEPRLRPLYAQQVFSLLNTGGKLVGVLFNRVFDGGPPFGGNQQEYETYFAPCFNSIRMEPCYNSAAPREGTELFVIIS